MKVDTLTRDTSVAVGAGYASPAVSVLLVLSQRDITGVQRTVNSVLTQTLSSLQLVIVDDTVDDDIATWLGDVQARDSRVIVLRHSRHLGIAALGWLEAFRHSSGAWFVLAREQDVFQSDALEALHGYASTKPGLVGFGYAESISDESGAGDTNEDSPEDQSQSLIMLRVRNFIARHTVLIPRDVVSQVGFLDPHVVLEGVAEWDFWRRLSERFELVALDIAVGGCAQNVGGTAVLNIDRWAVEEWMRSPRNDRLKLDRISNYDIYSPDLTHGRLTQEVCIAAAQRHGVSIQLATVEPQNDDGYILVVTLLYDATTALYFDMLPGPIGRRIRVVPNEPHLYFEALGRASAVVVLRAVRAFRPWLDAAQTLNIPAYYFLDDNMCVMAETGEATMPGEDFSLGVLKKELTRFKGVLISSETLLDYFCKHELHGNLYHFPVAHAFQEEEQANGGFGARLESDEIVFAFVGGLARSKMVWDLIIPALTRLAEEGAKIHFVAPGLSSDSEILKNLPASMRVSLLPWDHGYSYVVRRFARYAPDYMLLAASDTPNNLYKTRHPLLTARVIDAVAVLPNIEPYQAIDDGTYALMVDKPFELDAWYRMLKKIVDGHVDSTAIKERNRAYCASVFSGGGNIAVLREILTGAGFAPSWQLQYRRLALLSSSTGGNSGGQNELALRRNAQELLNFRRHRRYSWRHRVIARPSDIWNFCGAAFWPLQQAALDNGWKRRGSSLELSDSLHDKTFYDYEVELPAGVYGGLSLAVATDGIKQGKISVELISPVGKVAARANRDLGRINTSAPVQFRFKPVEIGASEIWRVRLRCRSAAPVYVYELVNRRGLNMFYGPPSPFMAFLEPSVKQDTTLSHVFPEDAVAGSLENAVNVKLIVEGDIPTNQIISRVMTEALDGIGTIEQCLITEFSPEEVLDGALVVMSRVSSPAALPMVEWMRDREIPYLYYIDDNFWELKGDTPLAQYYRCAPVRETLRMAITHSKGVIVNSALLADYVSKKFPSVLVTYLNAPFDFSLARDTMPSDKAPGEIRIGFSGNVSRAADFVEILPAFERLLREHSNVTLMFFGYCPPELVDRKQVVYVPTVTNYADFIALKSSSGLDIGIAPMTDSVANRYKTNNKYREYGALKIAGVYTNLSPYRESVVDGKTGLLVEHGPEAWYQALERLIVDHEFRADISNAAYEDVREHYAQSVVAEQWRMLLTEFVHKHSVLTPVARPDRATVARIQARKLFGRLRIRSLMAVSRVRTVLGVSKAAAPEQHNI